MAERSTGPIGGQPDHRRRAFAVEGRQACRNGVNHDLSAVAAPREGAAR